MFLNSKKQSINKKGHQLDISGNAWKKIDIGGYEITKDTILEFDFQSTKRTEISGIGFDNNNSINESNTLQLSGSQNWGIQEFKNYKINSGWTTYKIKAGDYFQGKQQFLTFTNDHN